MLVRLKSVDTKNKQSRQKDFRDSGFGLQQYRFLCKAMKILLLLVILTLVLSYIPAFVWVQRMERFVSKCISPKALAAAASTAGISSTVITWLIARAEDKICGARIADLIDSEYPDFFGCCFSLFLVHTLCCIILGNGELFWPALYSGIAILLFMCLLIRICYIFAIRADIREDIAFKYYSKECKRTSNTTVQRKAVLLHAAEYSRSSLIRDHNPSTMEHYLSLWKDVLSQLCKQNTATTSMQKDFYYRNQPDPTLEGAELSKEVWLTMMGIDASWPVQKQLILSSFESISDERYPAGPERTALLIGLVSAMLEVCDSSKKLIDRVQCLKTDGCPAWLFPELSCAMLMELLVIGMKTFSGVSEDEYTAFHYAANELWPDIYIAIRKQKDEHFSTLNDLLQYAEWAARREIHMPLNEYVFKVTDFFSDSNSSERLVNMEDADYRIKMLACLYLSAEYLKQKAEKNA